MKANGIICIRAKNAILSILAFLVIVPALAQLNYTSQKDFSLAGKDYELAASSRNYYAIPDGTYLHNNTSPAFPASPQDRNDYAEEKITYSTIRDLKKVFFHAENNNEEKSENSEISFKPTSFSYPKSSKVDIGIAEYSTEQLMLYAKVLKQYAKKNSFDTAYAFLSNMGMLSNKKRFFVINLVTLEIEQAGLVSHGRGQGHSVYDKQYSNETGSNSTSLGRYKISGKYKGGYGEAFKMIGLDSSNKNAYSRNIVLHSMTCIPDMESIMPACVSEGCPAVSDNFFAFIRQIIDSRKKPILLWIFDSNLEELVVEDNQERNSLAHEQNNDRDFAFQINQKLVFPKKNYANKRRKYFSPDLNPDVNSAEQNDSPNKLFFTLKPGYIPQSLNAAVFHNHNLSTPPQSWTPEPVNTIPVSNRTIFLPVDIGHVLTKRKKNQYVAGW